jgi:nitrogen fixation protein NifQ
VTGIAPGHVRLGADELYRRLMDAAAPEQDGFDAHVLASVLALAGAEVGDGGVPVTAGLGLTRLELAALVAVWFPRAESLLPGVELLEAQVMAEEELCLRQLLLSHCSAPQPLGAWLSAIVARRAQRPRHLWQDLGLQNRGELSRLMGRHFAPLAAKNRHDMKWKKFFCRALCLDGSFPICTAPSCGECDDFQACFGEETGESLLATRRR